MVRFFTCLNHQNSPSLAYLEKYQSHRIIIPTIIKQSSTTFTKYPIYSNDKTTIIVTKEVELTGILNSNTVEFFMKCISPIKKGGFYEYKPAYLAQIPIPNPTEPQRQAIETLVNQILELKKENPEADTSELEGEIAIVGLG